jgi:diguanylate cyclase (GGDEF)-like protein/PAS domain S-box-containing protein
MPRKHFLHKAEELMRRLETDKTLILDNLSELVTYKDRDMFIIWANKAARESVNLNDEDLAVRKCYEIWYQRSTCCEDCPVVKAMETGRRQSSERTSPDGRCWNITGLPLRDDTGNIIGSVEIAQEVTWRKRVEEALQEAHKRLDEIIDFLPEATFVIDCEGKVIAWNKAIAEVTGIPKAQMIGRKNFEYAIPFYGKRRPILIDLALLPESEINRFKKEYDEIGRRGNTLYSETYVSGTYGGQGAYIWAAAAKLHDANGNVIGAIETIRDITERKRVEESLREAHKRLDEIIEFLPDATFVIDCQGKVIAWNKAMAEMTGITKGQMIGRGEYEYAIPFYGSRRPILIDLALLSVSEINQFKKDYDVINWSGNTLYSEAYVSETYGGKGAYLWAAASRLHDADGNVLGAIETLRDITERKRFEEQLKYYSMHDQLTGLYNRTFFEEELKRLSVSREYPVTIISADLDDLKLINDTMGHDKGDQLLIAGANVVKKSLRESDVLARVGGDEFTAILPCTDVETGKSIVARIRENIACYNREHNELPLGLSLGVATSDTEEISFKETYKQADDMMYRDKFNRSTRGRDTR